MFSRISGLGLKGERLKRRKEASCGEIPALEIFSYNKSKRPLDNARAAVVTDQTGYM